MVYASPCSQAVTSVAIENGARHRAPLSGVRHPADARKVRPHRLAR